MFVVHLLYKEGSRPSQKFPWCEKENADLENSDGQCGSQLATRELARTTCAYCHYSFIKDLYITPELRNRVQPNPVHWSVHPVFSRDGKVHLLHWEAFCGQIDVYSIVYATRKKKKLPAKAA